MKRYARLLCVFLLMAFCQITIACNNGSNASDDDASPSDDDNDNDVSPIDDDDNDNDDDDSDDDDDDDDNNNDNDDNDNNDNNDNDNDDSAVEIVFSALSHGSFAMGSPGSESGRNSDETPHQATLTHNFEIGVREITQAEFTAVFAGYNPSWYYECGADCPVEFVSWYDALAFANVLSLRDGLSPCYVLSNAVCQFFHLPDDPYGCETSQYLGILTASVALNGVDSPYECEGYRLPTEAEWEYAARAGTTAAFNDGLNSDVDHALCEVPYHLTDIAWYCGDVDPFTGGTQPVGGKVPNAWGLSDMSGNVAEWAWDRYGAYVGDEIDPAGPDSGADRVTRGGSWLDGADRCRSAYRLAQPPGYRAQSIGFRVVRTLFADDDDNDDNDVIDDDASPADDDDNDDNDSADDDNGCWLDEASGLMWQTNAADVWLTLNDAAAACAQSRVGGHADWRLPTISELRTLIRGCAATVAGGPCGVADQCLTAGCRNQDCNGCAEFAGPGPGGEYWPAEIGGPYNTWYWSSSATTGLPNAVWVLFFYAAALNTDGIYAEPWTGYARCVR